MRRKYHPSVVARRASAAAVLLSLCGLGIAALGGGSVPAAHAATVAVPTFGLTHDLGAAGGEPSIQDDGQGHLYITTPVGTGSLNGTGVKLSRSLDGGKTFLDPQSVGGVIGGGDSDVTTDVTGKNVYIADLAAAFTNVLHSTDLGATFPAVTQAGPDDDREWLTPIGTTLVLTYHDFANNLPLIFISTDQGATWTPGGTAGLIIGPTDTGFVDSKCNTLVGKPVTDAQGNLYVLTNTSTLTEDITVGKCALAAPLDRMYLSVSSDGGHTFTTNLVNDISAGTTGNANSGSWGHSFNQLGIDASGNLYIDASGSLDGSLPLQNYLMVSTDHGKTFSKPIATHAGPNGQLFPAIAVGQAGQVAVGYYQGTKPDHHATGSNFQFALDVTFNATDPTPTFLHTTLTPLKGTTPHPDGICTDGIFCGTPASSGGNRNLADFESMTVDPTGNLEIIIPADCDACNATTENWFYKQTAGPVLVPGATNGNGTGNETWVAGSRTQPPPTPTPAPTTAPTAMPTGAPAGLTNTSAATPGRAATFGIAVLALAGAGLAMRRRRRRSRT